MSNAAPQSGQSLLAAAGIAPARPDEGGLLITFKSGEERAIFDSRPLEVLYRLSPVRRLGGDFVEFEDGSIVAPSEVAFVRPTTRSEVEREPETPGPVERVEAAAEKIEAAASAVTGDDDLSSWTDQEIREALEALEQAPVKTGIQRSADDAIEMARLAAVLMARGAAAKPTSPSSSLPPSVPATTT